MKRIVALIILNFMIGVNLFPIFINNQKERNSLVEPIMLSDITYEIKDITKKELSTDFLPSNYREIAIKNMQSELEEISSIISKKEWFIAYKNIIFKYAKWIEPPKTVFDEFSVDEIKLICQMAETECFQQDFDSKCNVIAVAFNRLDSGDFGDTMTEVITAKNQFAYSREVITEDTLLAVQYVFESKYDAEGALYFHSNQKKEIFNRAKYIFSDNAIHHFYK